MKPILIFDYDGTLHETMRIYAPAIRKVVRWLKDSCGVSVEVPPDQRISSWLGMNTADMWKDFMPELPEDLKKKAGKRVGDFMLEGLRTGRGAWYSGVPEMLDTFSGEGYSMAVLSNCGIGYAKAHWDTFSMDRWFTAFFPCECWDNAPKTEIMADIARDFGAAVKRTPVRRKTAGDMSVSGTFAREKQADMKPAGSSAEHFIVIGDRASDLGGAASAGAPFIGCLYGYGSRGELQGAAELVKAPSEIPDAVRKTEKSVSGRPQRGSV
jgi:phosphoglycolate phosphatase